MKILLVEPGKYNPDGTLRKPRQMMLPSLSLPLLAALTPPGHTVSIVSELFEEIDYGAGADLVGITSEVVNARRAYTIADEFRRRGKYVVMGGIHPTMATEEALEHADTVVAGEAESLWPAFLSDLVAGKPGRLYREGARHALAGLPVPRFDLLKKERYFSLSGGGLLGGVIPTPIYPVQAARGCPHDCSFCYVSSVSGKAYRPRPVPEVAAELRALRGRGYFFVDDNIFADRRHATQLFEAITPLGIAWFGQATLAAGDDPELLRLAYRSGCRMMLVGIETVSGKVLRSVSKTHNNVQAYRRQLAAYNASGIGVSAGMIFGFDGDTQETFREAYDFLVENHIPYTCWRPLVPFPGTRYYSELKAAGRLRHERWWLEEPGTYRMHDLKTGGMPADDFDRCFRYYYAKLFSPWAIARRLLLPPQKGLAVKLGLNVLMWMAKSLRVANPIYNFIFQVKEKA